MSLIMKLCQGYKKGEREREAGPMSRALSEPLKNITKTPVQGSEVGGRGVHGMDPGFWEMKLVCKCVAKISKGQPEMIRLGIIMNNITIFKWQTEIHTQLTTQWTFVYNSRDLGLTSIFCIYFVDAEGCGYGGWMLGSMDIGSDVWRISKVGEQLVIPLTDMEEWVFQVHLRCTTGAKRKFAHVGSIDLR